MTRTRLVGLCMGGALLTSLAAPATAATIVVNLACTPVQAVTAANTDAPVAGCTAGSGADTIVLAPGALYVLDTAASGITGGHGPNAFPVVVTPITIAGNGAVLRRDPSAPEFRFFEVDEEFPSAGALRLENLTLQGGRVQSSYAPTGLCGGGGAIRAEGDGNTTLELDHVTLVGNEARADAGPDAVCFGGGAVLTFNMPVSITSSRLVGNASVADGGAVQAFNANPIALHDSVVDGNRAVRPGEQDASGGGMAISGGRLELRRSVISHNVGEAVGGIWINGEDVSLIANTTISANQGTGASPSSGLDTVGGLWTNTDMTIVSSTIAGNLASGPASIGGLHVRTATTLVNTIVAGNTVDGAVGAPTSDCGVGEFGSLRPGSDNNLFGLGTGCPSVGFADVLVAPADVFTTVLGPLALSPPGTTETHALLPGSPALDAADAGVCASPAVGGVDQRGVARPQGSGCDIGAFELEPGAPVAADDGATTAEDTPVVIDVLANDTDPNGDPLTITGHTQGLHGSVVDNGDGTLTYTPAPDFNGNDSFAYSISDGHGGTDGATVSVVVTAVNDDPQAGDDAYVTSASVPLSVSAAGGVLANDTDVDGDALLAVLVAGPSHAVLNLAADGSFSYSPEAGFSGADSFTYRAEDPTGGQSGVATVTVQVNAVNQAPAASPDAFGVASGETLTVPAPGVLANDGDPEGGALTAGLVAGPASGALTLGADGSFTYVPAFGFVGNDTFTYRASDGAATSAPATVTLVVTGVGFVPIAGTTTPIPGGVGPFTGFASAPAIGAGYVAFLGAGAAGQSGLYAMTPAGDSPIRLADAETPIPGGTGTFTAVRDPVLSAQPGDPCQEAAFAGDGPAGQHGLYATSFGGVSCAASPIVLVDLGTPIPGGNGTFTAVRNPVLSATPGDPCRDAAFEGDGPAGQQGLYTVSFGNGSCASSPVVLVDLDTPVPGGGGTFTAVRDPALSATAGEPCRDAAFVGTSTAGQGVFATTFGGPSCSDSIETLVDAGSSLPGGGVFMTFADTTLRTTPGDPCREAAFIGDGSGGRQGVYTVSFGDASCAGLPETVADRGTPIPQGQGTFDTFLTLSASGAHTALLATGSGGQKGIYLASTLTKIVDLSDVLGGRSLADLRFGGSGLSGPGLAFTAVFADGSEGVFRVELDLPDGNDPPVAVSDSFLATEDTPLTVSSPGVLVNDSDPEQGALSGVLITGPTQGTLSLASNGSFTYVPAAEFSGHDSFAYRAIDPLGVSSNVATVTIAVAAVNDAPVAVADTYVVATGTTLQVPAPGVLANDGDAEGSSLTAVLATGPAHGVLGLGANGAFTYTPSPGFTGTDSFTYRADDGFATSAPAMVTLVVQAASGATWVPTGSLGVARTAHTATLLPSGKVLVAGGHNLGGLLRSAEIYHPATGAWTATGKPVAARSGHTATLLANGRVLVVGGVGGSGALKSAELYNPSTGQWTATGSLGAARLGHTATLLSNGKVLVAGGAGSSGKSAQLYDPSTGQWSTTGGLATARAGHTATLLANGRVLVAGGLGASADPLKSAEIYNPSSGAWTSTGALAAASALHTATRLSDGRVLVAGGVGSGGNLARAEIYDTATGSWSAVAAQQVARSLHTATLLPDGTVLTAGGFNNQAGPLAGAELFDPTTGQWIATAPLDKARGSHTATLLPNGKVLAAGGGLLGLKAAELYGIQ